MNYFRHARPASSTTLVEQTKFNLMSDFLNMKKVTLHSTNGQSYTGFILSIQLEDGSGSSFNITIGEKTFHIRTID